MSPWGEAVPASPVTGKGIRRGGQQYEAIHEALAASALQALAADGYDGVTHAVIAEGAGVSERTAFRHFPTKLELAVAGIQQLPTYEGWLDGPGTSWCAQMVADLSRGGSNA